VNARPPAARALRRLLTACLLLAVASSGNAWSLDGVLALGRPLALPAAVAETELPARARAVVRALFSVVGQDFIAREGLTATPAEIAEVQAYNAAFERHDREQRRRKLTELDTRLAALPVDAPDRPRLEAFRATLARLARYEADVDAGTEPRVEADAATLAGWVEHWKLDAALHAKYGGVVGLAPHGPYAHGARASLVREYQREGRIEIADPGLRSAVREVLDLPPRMALPAEVAPDFTPFWRRPLQSSYLAQ